MKNIKYFALGILSITFLIPVIDKFLELSELWIETLKIKPSIKILNYQKDSQVIKEFIKPIESIYDEDEYCSEYDDYDE